MGECTRTRAGAPMRGYTRAQVSLPLHPVADTTRFHPGMISCKPDGEKPVTSKKNDMKDKQSIHEKAIRLIEGGIVDVDGHSVKLVNVPDMFDTCNSCEMDCLCHIGTEMYYVCIECVGISKKNCILELVTSSSNRT